MCIWINIYQNGLVLWLYAFKGPSTFNTRKKIYRFFCKCMKVLPIYMYVHHLSVVLTNFKSGYWIP